LSRHLEVMTALDREIDLAPRSRERPRVQKRRYGKLLWRAHRVHDSLSEEVARTEEALAQLDVLPSRKAMAARAVHRLRADIDALAKVIANCEARVLREEKVPMADKKLSVSDPDAGFIAKGQRQPVIGYKPQLARSGRGFITGLLLPEGNAADSKQFIPMLDEVERCTGVVPEVVSVDDGYASKANVEEARSRGVRVVSISGAKGSALTTKDDWDSEEYTLARDQRSAVESLMFTLKQGFHFGEVARRGLVQVHGELLEKAIAYNFCHMVRMRLTLERDRCRALEVAA
jgi:IS5 family transposase